MTMATDTTNVVIVVIIIILFFMLMSACCRQLRAAYEEHLTAEELTRRHQAFFNGTDVGDEESVRVTARQGDHVLGVYEIRMPRRPAGGRLFSSRVPPPPPFHTALQNSSPIYYVDSEDPPPSYQEYINSQKDVEDKDRF